MPSDIGSAIAIIDWTVFQDGVEAPQHATLRP